MVWEEKVGEGFLPMRACKKDGHPQVGHWIWTGEVDLAWEVGIECKCDWVPHGLNGECLHTSRLGEYDTIQMRGQGYKELVHRQLYSSWDWIGIGIFWDRVGLGMSRARTKSPQSWKWNHL